MIAVDVTQPGELMRSLVASEKIVPGNPDESPSSDPGLFAQVQEGVRKHCPGMIVQFSTGGRGRDPSTRGSSLKLKPDPATFHGMGSMAKK